MVGKRRDRRGGADKGVGWVSKQGVRGACCSRDEGRRRGDSGLKAVVGTSFRTLLRWCAGKICARTRHSPGRPRRPRRSARNDASTPRCIPGPDLPHHPCPLSPDGGHPCPPPDSHATSADCPGPVEDLPDSPPVTMTLSPLRTSDWSEKGAGPGSRKSRFRLGLANSLCAGYRLPRMVSPGLARSQPHRLSVTRERA